MHWVLFGSMEISSALIWIKSPKTIRRPFGWLLKNKILPTGLAPSRCEGLLKEEASVGFPIFCGAARFLWWVCALTFSPKPSVYFNNILVCLKIDEGVL